MNNNNMCNVIPKVQRTLLFTGTMLDINYFARTATAGKEFDMVTQYINFLVTKYERLKRKRAVIFIEPQLDTGYPDIVVVEFNSIPQSQWFLVRNNFVQQILRFYIIYKHMVVQRYATFNIRLDIRTNH